MAAITLKGFISYAHKDKEFLPHIKEGINVFKNLIKDEEGNIIPFEAWTDKDIVVGQDWRETITQNVDKADFAILLLSENFFNSKFINTHELPTWIEKIEHGKSMVLFPILLTDCTPEETYPELAHLQYFGINGDRVGYNTMKKVPYDFIAEFDYQNGNPILKRNKYLTTYHRELTKALNEALQPLIAHKKKAAEEEAQRKAKIEAEQKAQAEQTTQLEALNANKNHPFTLTTTALLKAKDIMAQRAKSKLFNESLYVERKGVDEKIVGHLANTQQGQPLLVTGNPLAGKTRAIYQALKQVPATTLVIVNKLKLSHLEPYTTLPEPLPGTDRIMVVWDDLDDSLAKDKNKHITNQLLNAWIIEQDIPVVATCRTGDELETLSTQLDDDLWELFRDGSNKVQINKVTWAELPEDFKADRTSISSELVNDFDGNIGSLFVPLYHMRDRYNALVKAERKVPTLILEAIKAHYVLGNTEGDKGSYLEHRIKEYVKRHEAYYKVPKWQSSLDKLREDDEFGLSFIELNGDLITIEETYLDKKESKDKEVVAPGKYANHYLKKVHELYDKKEQIQFGWPVDVKDYTVKMNQASYRGALDIFKGMEEMGISPNVFHYNILIKKARDKKTAEVWFGQMKKNRVKPTVFTFAGIIPKAKDFQEALGILEKMKQENISPNEVTFNSLLNKAKDFQEALGILEKMKQENISPNEVTFTSLLNKAKDFQEALGILEKMKQENISPNEVTFTSLLNKAKDFQEALGILEKMKQENISPNEVTFNSLLNKAKDFQEALGILEKMKQENISPNEVTFNSLLNKAKDFQEALGILEKMKQENISPNEVTFTSLLNKAKDFQEALGILEKMKQENIEPDEVTFNSLLNKAKDFQEALGILEKMKQENIEPDEVTFNSLLNKAKDFQEALGILEKMKQENISPNEVTFTSLLNKAKDFQEALGILEKMKQENISPNEVTFTSLLNKAKDFQEALGILEKMKQENISPNEVTFNSLLNKAKDFQEALGILEKMKQENIEPDEVTFNSLLNKAPGKAEANALIAQMKAAGLKPDQYTYNTYRKVTGEALVW